MNGAEMALGIVLMLMGVALITVAVFRALGHTWNLGIYEMWALPVAGIALILLGRWVIA